MLWKVWWILEIESNYNLDTLCGWYVITSSNMMKLKNWFKCKKNLTWFGFKENCCNANKNNWYNFKDCYQN